MPYRERLLCERIGLAFALDRIAVHCRTSHDLRYGMIRKSASRFSEKIMLKTKNWTVIRFN